MVEFDSLDERVVKSMKFFAFGLGYQGAIDPGVGRFIARSIRTTDVKND